MLPLSRASDRGWVRGRAELDVVEGIPDEYLETSGTYAMTPEQRVEWEADVRSLYDGMVRIVVTPDVGEADRLRDDPPERGRGTGPAAGRISARLSGHCMSGAPAAEPPVWVVRAVLKQSQNVLHRVGGVSVSRQPPSRRSQTRRSALSGGLFGHPRIRLPLLMLLERDARGGMSRLIQEAVSRNVGVADPVFGLGTSCGQALLLRGGATVVLITQWFLPLGRSKLKPACSKRLRVPL
jgi:hypothetical protein